MILFAIYPVNIIIIIVQATSILKSNFMDLYVNLRKIMEWDVNMCLNG